DHIDLTIPLDAATRGDSVAIVLRMRNSLLNTVLLYDELLAAGGGQALDWVGRDLQQITPAIDLGRWYARRMGMRIEAYDVQNAQEGAATGGTGPGAFPVAAVVVPAPKPGDLHVRLSFTADNWRIDRVAVGSAFRHPNSRTIPVAEVRRDDGSPDADVLA